MTLVELQSIWCWVLSECSAMADDRVALVFINPRLQRSTRLTDIEVVTLTTVHLIHNTATLVWWCFVLWSNKELPECLRWFEGDVDMVLLEYPAQLL